METAEEGRNWAEEWRGVGSGPWEGVLIVEKARIGMFWGQKIKNSLSYWSIESW